MSFDSKLQVFKKMDTMSSELQKVRASEEHLRAERRLIFEKLRGASRGPNSDSSDNEHLASIIGEVTALLAAEVVQSESSASLQEATHQKLPEVEPEPFSDTEVPPAEGIKRASQATGSTDGTPATPFPQQDVQVTVTQQAPSIAGAQNPAAGASGEPPSTVVLPALATSALQLSGEPSSPLPTVRDRKNAPRVWAQDADKCSICSSAFNLINRRHHCRNCGINVCQKCSPYRVHLTSPIPRPLKWEHLTSSIPPRLKGIEGPTSHRICMDCHEPSLRASFCLR
eukprot:TRINITY_DN9848_c0_g2_i4.p1 TRINITY_DN9848_c0_g2~~TRINITY_DN9848_c0_g2_i4.p1  ORF type:complete len:284 (+),score=64.59 TRINITY_DN9848_c0_g2_i4:105-956(+)